MESISYMGGIPHTSLCPPSPLTWVTYLPNPLLSTDNQNFFFMRHKRRDLKPRNNKVGPLLSSSKSDTAARVCVR